MSADKMREQFEAWECDADQGPQTDPVWLMYDAATNTYPLDKIQSRWEVWQASRAAVDVELPEAWRSAGSKHELMHKRDTVAVLESLGLKVKA